MIGQRTDVRTHNNKDRYSTVAPKVTPGGGVKISVFSGSLAKNVTPPGGQ
jgi:hypothetical protein